MCCRLFRKVAITYLGTELGEHMIFLGSKKYPGEAQFEEFLSENGGESNAYTECEYTCTSAAICYFVLMHKCQMYPNVIKSVWVVFPNLPCIAGMFADF